MTLCTGERVDVVLAEAAREGDVFGVREVLAGEREHQVLHQQLVAVLAVACGKRSQVETGDRGAEGTSELGDGDGGR